MTSAGPPLMSSDHFILLILTQCHVLQNYPECFSKNLPSPHLYEVEMLPSLSGRTESRVYSADMY